MSETFPYEVGDVFEGGPIQLSKYISLIQSVGGEFDYEGETVTLTYLPWDYKKGEAVPYESKKDFTKVEVSPEPEAKEEVEEVVEAPVAEEVPVEAPGLVDAPVVEEAPVVVEDFKEIAVVAPAPKTRGRKPAAKTVEPTE